MRGGILDLDIKEIKLKYEYIDTKISNLQAELQSIPITNFELNPRILEITQKIKLLNIEKEELSNKIKELED